VAALRGVDMEVGAGEVVGLVGANGSESPPRRASSPAETPDAGAVVVDRTSLPPGDVCARLGAGVGVVFRIVRSPTVDGRAVWLVCSDLEACHRTRQLGGW